jgi:hypothetical protein
MLSAIARRLPAGLAVLWLLTFASPAGAQYFGQNKVLYRDLDFQVLQTEHFDIYFYPREQAGTDIAARLAERWYVRLAQLLDHQLRGRQPLILYASPAEFRQTNVIPGDLGEGVGGVTEPIRRRIVIPFGGSLRDTDHVIGHELVHAFQYDMTSGGRHESSASMERLPLWFIEGMAEYLSIGPVDPNTAMWLRDAVQHEELPSIADLDNPKYFPYRWGQAFWAYVGGRWGDATVRRMLAIAASAGNVDTAIKQVLGVTPIQLSADWHDAIRDTYRTVLASTAAPGDVGRTIIQPKGLGTELNVGPAISPDGRRLAFLSQRSVFSTDLYVADAQTGRVLHRLTSTATNPHFNSIQFIYSAGEWDSASRRLVIGAVTGGHPSLAIFDGASGRKEQEFVIKDVDQIVNPSWSPDGHAICFSGMSQGLTDLFVYDIKTSRLRRLTHDAFSDVQPAWSPDGTRIAFATDRFTTNLDTLAIGSFRLAVLDVASGAITPVASGMEGDAFNPQWAPDSKALYFVSNRTGIPNLYTTPTDGDEIAQLTNISTGLSGITSSSPALSVAASTGTRVFSMYTNGKYAIAAVPSSVRGESPLPVTQAATLPPVDRRPSHVVELLNQPTHGLPAAEAAGTVVPYNASLSLEGIGQPFVVAGADRFGAAVGGGIALSFSDMLNNHTLYTAAQFSSIGNNFSIKNLAAQVGYLNQARRWNWGFVVGQVPYLSGGFQSSIGATPSGDIVQVDQNFVFRQTERSATGILTYPFSRAKRVEFLAGGSQISFDQITQTTVSSLVTGDIVSDDTTTTSLGRSLALGNASMAFVSDTANFGATSPVAGERYRLEVSPTFGSLNFTGVLADYRRYFMPAPFYTLATRVLHYGRYGSGAQDPRLFPLYLGYPSLVRGYDVNSFDAADCVPTATSACPAFDRLLGSRTLVGNVEFRFPLLRPFGLTEGMYGPIPVEVAFFADAGVAWNSDEKPSFLGGSRKGVSSAGVALRVNLLGFAVGEFDFVRPFQRPGKGWTFMFNLTPGF